MRITSLSKVFHLTALIGALWVALPAPSALAQGFPGAPGQADMVVNAAQRSALVEALIRELKQGYVFPDRAAKLEQSLRAAQKRGEYDRITSAEKLASALTEHMQRETKDLHLNLVYSEQAIPEQVKNQKPAAEEIAQELAEMRGHNFGIERIERLPFNIGYLDLRAFALTKDGAQSMAAAMTLLANMDSLIIDLRKNGGGDSNMVTLIASYLLDERTHLSDIYFREGNRTEQNWSTDYVAGAKFGQNKDVYVLTSKASFSAAEDLSYTLQQLKRATIVGETTGGGAHPGDFMRLDAHFSAFIPNGRSINAITKTNWEGVGVTPDLKVLAEDAFKTAQAMILKKKMSSEKNPRTQERLKARIAKVESENTASSIQR